MGVETLTFGCRLNSYESEVVKSEAERAGLADALIVNTCAVTGEAVRQARQAIRRARRDHPARRIIVTGCAAQTEPRSFADMVEVDLVLGNAEKMKAASYSPLIFDAKLNDKVRVNDIMSVREQAGHLVEGMDGRTRAFVQIQNGCDHRCTFCIIPYGRGPSRSVPMGEVVEQVKRLVGNGYLEVVLTGVDITSYGSDLPGKTSLGTLVQAILKYAPDLPRLRLSTIDSVEIDQALFDAVASDRRLMPHLHLSLQSGDDMILKRMKRRHLRSDTLRFVDRIKESRPDVVFGADIIAGFPTETDEMFENSLRIVEDATISYLHVFAYSARAGTPAARMPQVPQRLRAERAARLRELGKRRHRMLCESRVGKTELVLTERNGVGRTEQFVTMAMPDHDAGELVAVRVTGTTATGLVGEIVRSAA